MIRQKGQLEAFISENGARIVQRGAPDKDTMISGLEKPAGWRGISVPGRLIENKDQPIIPSFPRL